MIFCISMVSVVTFPYSLLFHLFGFYLFFFQMSLAKGWSILFIFSKNQFSVSLILSTVILIFIYFHFNLHYFFSSANFGFVDLSFSCSFRLDCHLRFFFFMKQGWITIKFPLRMAFAAHHKIWIVLLPFSFISQYFSISSLIASLIHWFQQHAIQTPQVCSF